MTNELMSARRFLRQQFPRGGKVLCAVSGGLDSMCLLDFMRHQPGFGVCAAHFNHQLRGPLADRDEAFVRETCAAWKIPFFSGCGDTRALAREEGLSIEEAARQLRYAFLERTAAEEGCHAVLTAHHADDSAETMLLNLLRGTGSAGLAGIPAARGGIYRPFLGITREELRAYAAGHEIVHVEDETNETDEAARNVLRHQVLPVLRELNPGAVRNMARTAAVLAKESEALEALAAQLAAGARRTPGGKIAISCAALAQAPEAVAGRSVLLLMGEMAGGRRDLTQAHVAAVLHLAAGTGRTSGTISLPYGLAARRERETLYVERTKPAPSTAAIALNQQVRFGEWTVAVETTPSVPGAWAMSLPWGAEMQVSIWQPGDRMDLPGGRGSRSFKRLCAERGIPPHLRDGLPVLRVEGLPAAAARLGVDQNFLPPCDGVSAFVTFKKETEENTHEK